MYVNVPLTMVEILMHINKISFRLPNQEASSDLLIDLKIT